MKFVIFCFICIAVHSSISAVPVPGVDFKYYTNDNYDSYNIDPATNTKIWRWYAPTSLGGANLKPTQANEAPQPAVLSPMTITPPSITLLELDTSSSYPASGSYYCNNDLTYVVLSGNVTFGQDGGKIYGYGDVFWAMAGQTIGPISNVGGLTSSNAAKIWVIGADYVLNNPPAPSSDNPSINPKLVSSRNYRRVDAQWMPNPSPHSEQCNKNGGVQNMMFDAVEGTQYVMRVKWGGNCSIPEHYHPTGALYVVLYGEMYFVGDYPDHRGELLPGEIRWVRSGFHYGPELNGPTNPMEITVLGTDTPPTFDVPPEGPYKVQETKTITHVFDTPNQ